MGTLKADLEVLGKLSARLHELGDNASAATPTKKQGTTPWSPVLLSVTAADDITRTLITDTLIPAIEERLHETGDVMANIARHYKNTDDNNAGEVLAVYNQATGDWTA